MILDEKKPPTVSIEIFNVIFALNDDVIFAKTNVILEWCRIDFMFFQDR